MAKKQGIDPKASTAARIKRTEAYAEKVRLLFAQTVNDILAINKTMPKLDDGVMFSFDGESLKKQKEVEALLRRLHSSVTMAIREGVNLEWAQANAEADQLIKSVFGQRVLDSPEFTAWTQRNTAARDAFLARSEKGLNLSDRVWKSVRQLRDEMEVAMTVSMGEGKSASAMSREVRQYLNDPDLMFRRFRYKKGEDAEGNPIYGRKWKKRVKDEATGKYKWIDYDRDSYKTGAGVYKSSAKNAMGLTRTETNIAYRRADHERWMNEEFVIGQRIQLSQKHPEKDICDKLQGDYPKDFVFDGWHPQCFCFATPILLPDSETDFMEDWFLEGKDWEGELKRRAEARMIKDYPDGFKDWVAEHADDIQAARKRGTEPYFIRENAKVIDRFMGVEGGKQAEKDIHDQMDTMSPETRRKLEKRKEIQLAKKEYDALTDEWLKVKFFDESGGYVAKHALKDKDDMTRTGIAAEVNTCLLLASLGKRVLRLPENVPGKIDEITIDGKKYRDLLKFKPGKDNPRGYPDAYFDGQTWDVKAPEFNNNVDSLRQLIKDGRKADNVIFIVRNESDIRDIREAIFREIGRHKNDGQWRDLPNIYYLQGDKLVCLWEK